MGIVKLYLIRCQFCEDFTDGAWETEGIETLDEMADSVRDLVGHLIDVHSEHIVTIAAQRKEQRADLNSAIRGLSAAIMERFGVNPSDAAIGVDPSGNSAIAGVRIPVPEGQSVTDFLKNVIGQDMDADEVICPTTGNRLHNIATVDGKWACCGGLYPDHIEVA